MNEHTSSSDNASTPGIGGSPASLKVAAVLVTSLFFFWGLVNNSLPAVIAKVREACDLSALQAGYLASAFWVAYFVMPIPAAMVMRRYGYKGAIVFGLFLGTLGCAIFGAAASMISYPLFLLAPFVAASGMAFLESAANPYISVLGDPERAPNRLNLAQAFNGLAGFVASLWGTKLILGAVEYDDKQLRALNPDYYAALDTGAGTPLAISELKHASPAFLEALAANARSVSPVFVVAAVAFLILTVVFILARLPDSVEPASNEKKESHLGALVRNRYFVFGVIAMFCYIGAQVGVAEFFLMYVPSVTGMPKVEAGVYLGLALGCFMLGRVVGTSLMTLIKPRMLLLIFAVANVLLLTYCGFATPGESTGREIAIPSWLMLGDHILLTSHPAPYALMAVNFFMSIMFPTIFSLSITGLGRATKTGSTILIMSIVGGAVFAPVMGAVADQFKSMAFAYFVPMFCMIPVLVFALLKTPQRAR